MELKLIVESILFAAQKPLTPRELRDVLELAAEANEDPLAAALKKTREADLETALLELEREHREGSRSYVLVCVAGAWQFASRPEYAPWLKALLGRKVRPPRLSQPALETLAIIAYRQPLTRAEIEQVRGVSVDGVMQTLLERGLVEQTGRSEVPGRPQNYGTTTMFLEYFGLRNLDELPAADELRKIEIKKPETLLTVDSGLATAPPAPLTQSSNATAGPEPAPGPAEGAAAAGEEPAAGSGPAP